MALKRSIASIHVDTSRTLRTGSLIANETNDEPKHPHVVARIQHLHGEPIAVRDSSDQHLVRCRLHFGLVILVASDYVGFSPANRASRPPCLFFQYGLSLINDIWGLASKYWIFASSAASPS